MFYYLVCLSIKTINLKNETLSKERLRLEEELRRARLECEELLKGKTNEEREMANQIAALQKQFEASQRASAEHDRIMRQLTREREKLQLEIENTQKQASEVQKAVLRDSSCFRCRCSRLSQPVLPVDGYLP